MPRKINQVLIEARSRFFDVGIKSASLDAEILLAFLIKKNREYLFSHDEEEISEKSSSKYKKLVKRHCEGEPVAYITGHKEFFGLDFIVDKTVLIPRPETEILVEETSKVLSNLLLNKPFMESRCYSRYQSRDYKIICIDIGTGSGCIITALAKNIKNKNIKFIGLDISQKVLGIAKKNITKHKLKNKIILKRSNLLENFKNYKLKTKKHLLIMANLPYLSQKIYDRCPKSVKKYEPKLALKADNQDGLDLYRKLLDQIKILRSTNYPISTVAFFEISPEQKNLIKKEIFKKFPLAKIKFYKDLSQKWRLAKILF